MAGGDSVGGANNPKMSFAEPSSRLRSVLVSGQMAVAVVLLSGAGLLFGSFVRMRTADLGFEADGLIVMGVGIKGASGASGCGFRSPWACWDVLLAELRAVRGVELVAAASNVPLQPSKWAPRLGE